MSLTAFYNRNQLIDFLSNDATGPGFGGEIEINNILTNYQTQDLVPESFVREIFNRLYFKETAEREFKIMQTKVTGYSVQ